MKKTHLTLIPHDLKRRQTPVSSFFSNALLLLVFCFAGVSNNIFSQTINSSSFSPSCTITGPGTACPGSYVIYKGVSPVPYGYTYTWSITGSGSITGSTNGASIIVKTQNTCNKTFTISLTIKKGTSIKNSCQKIVTVQDNIKPTIFSPADKKLQCGGSTDPKYTGAPFVLDNCDAYPSVTYKDVYTSANCTGRKGIDRVWTATDDCGNYSTCTQHITFTDKTPPVIYCPRDVALECGASTDPKYTGTPAVKDNCDVYPSVTYKDVYGDINCTGNKSIVRTWTARDHCGNSSYCTQKISFVDKTPPVIYCPNDFLLECGSSDPQVTGTPTVEDNCDPNPSITYQDNPDGTGGIVRTWTAQDVCGNSSYCTQKITLSTDKTPPYISCPNDISEECGSADPKYTGVPTVTDNCDPYPAVSYQDNSDGSGGIIRTWTAKDASGNSSYCTQKITLSTDKTPPYISCPNDVSEECGSADPKYTGVPTVTDNCDPYPAVSYQDNYDANGGIIRTWTAKDVSGNSSYCTQKITLSTDKTPPYISCPNDVSEECGSADPKYTGVPTVTDNCDPYPSVSYQDNYDANGGIIRTWTAKDVSGNSSYCTQKITLSTDKTPPYISCPNDVSEECGSADPKYTGVPTVTDNCDPYPSVSYQDNYDANGGIIRTWTAKDVSGNSSYCTQKITLSTDKTPPYISCPNDVSLNCGGSTDPKYTGVPGVTDNCDPYPSVEYQDNFDGSGGIARTWKAQDNAGNSSYCIQKINGVICGTITGQQLRTEVTGAVKNTFVKVYPMPYSNKINFNIVSSVSGKTTLEIFDLLGQKVASLFEGNLDAGVERIIQYNVPPGKRVPLVYVLKTPTNTFHGTLIPGK